MKRRLITPICVNVCVRNWHKNEVCVCVLTVQEEVCANISFPPGRERERERERETERDDKFHRSHFLTVILIFYNQTKHNFMN